MWPEHSRPTRDQLGLILAQVWSFRGTCARRRVGCVLFDVDGHELATGYNGPPVGEHHCRLLTDQLGPATLLACEGRDAAPGTSLEKCQAIHAEQNALLRCADVRRVHSCYVTASPCLHCVKMLANTACKRIVFLDHYPGSETAAVWWTRQPGREWLHFATTMQTLDLRCGVTLRQPAGGGGAD